MTHPASALRTQPTIHLNPPMHEIIPVARIEREAAQAAKRYTCINDACPYPFGSSAAHLFKQLFLAARENMTKNAICAISTGADSYQIHSDTP